MVCQCRSHPSIFLWGVRVSGSADDESFYKRTNETVRRLDPTRPTAGTRSTRRSQLLEDVYAYTDYSYHGRGVGCEARTAVTPDTRKGYLISEFEGAQFPAKPSTTSPTAWHRPCATPPSSTTPSLSRAWRAASAGA